jgi:type II secretory pathway pseudopilin PulG
MGMKKDGFTLIELLIFTGIFTGLALIVTSILVIVTRIQSRESGVAEVTSQSNFVLRTVQDTVERASMIDMTQDSASSTLALRMASSSVDPTYIYLSSGTVYLKETSSGTPVALSSSRVTVSTLQFTRRSHAGSSDTVSVTMQMDFNTSNLQQRFSQLFMTGVRKVSAAVFDSNITPSVTNLTLGTSGLPWKSINGTIYFNGTNVGVGITTPVEKLEIDGGVKLNPSTTKPTCDSTARGMLWFTPGSGAVDRLDVCNNISSTSTVYAWTQIN